MSIRVIQTCDPFRYFDLFAITSRPTRRFCQLKGIPYTGYVGIKLGCFPWHATYNRIPLLAELLASGYRGWVLYLDADAYIADLTFDIHGFLAARSERALLGAVGGEQDWNINAGILFFNLAQPACQRVIQRWSQAFADNVGEERLRKAETPWPPGIKDDQLLLHEILATEGDGLSMERLPLSLVGWPESEFVRQLLRLYGSVEDRMSKARSDIDALGAQPGYGT